MKLISVELLVQAIREQGLDAVYEKLEALFYTEPLAFINSDGGVVFRPYDPEELYEYLEILNEKEVEL